MNVAILGCGPAGLLAAHAAALKGHAVDVFSRKQKTIMPGAMYVHQAIAGLGPVTADALIRFRKEGTAEGYATKVYGDAAAPTSWESFPSGLQMAWDMRAMYDKLWEMYGRWVFDHELDQARIDQIVTRHDLTISTIPAKVLCDDANHQFLHRDVWIRNEHRIECERLGDPCVIYNGDPKYAHYRTSLIFGHGSTEFGHQVAGAQRGIKPLNTDCDCRPDVMRVGRFGKWQKGVLVHHAFQEVRDAVQ